MLFTEPTVEFCGPVVRIRLQLLVLLRLYVSKIRERFKRTFANQILSMSTGFVALNSEELQYTV